MRGRVVRSVAKNTLFLAIADVSAKLVAFGFHVFAARRLGVDQYGVLSFALAFVAMFSVLTDLGLGLFVAREVARDTGAARRLIGNAMGIKFLAMILVLVAIGVLVNVLGYPRSTVMTVYICSLVTVDAAVTMFYRQVFQGFGKTLFSALGRLLQGTVLAAGVVVVFRSEPTLTSFAWLNVVPTLVAAAFVWVMASLYLVRPSLNLRFREWTRIVRGASPFAIGAVLVIAYYWNGAALLSKLADSTAVGLYSAPFRLVIGASFPALAFAGAVYPVMSRVFVEERTRLRDVLHHALRYMLLISVAMAFFGTASAGPLILSLFGQSYSPSVPVLRVLVWWAFFMHMNSLLSHYFQSANRAKLVTKQAGLSLAVCLSISLVLIPSTGALGVAIAMLAAEAAGFAVLLVCHLRSIDRVGISGLVSHAGRAGLAALVAIVPVVLVGRSAFWIAAAAGVALYPVLLVLSGGIGRADLVWFRVLIGRADAA